MATLQKRGTLNGSVHAAKPLYYGTFIHFVMISLQNLPHLLSCASGFQKSAPEILFLTKISGAKIENRAGILPVRQATKKEPRLFPDVVLFLLHMAPLAGIEPATNP